MLTPMILTYQKVPGLGRTIIKRPAATFAKPRSFAKAWPMSSLVAWARKSSPPSFRTDGTGLLDRYIKRLGAKTDQQPVR